MCQAATAAGAIRAWDGLTATNLDPSAFPCWYQVKYSVYVCMLGVWLWRRVICMHGQAGAACPIGDYSAHPAGCRELHTKLTTLP